MELITDSEIEKTAQRLVDNITGENWDKLRKKAEEMKLPSEDASIPCTLCKCNCGTHKVCEVFSPISCLCKEFGHNYCQGPLGSIPSSYSENENLSNITFNKIPEYKLCRLALRIMANDSMIPGGYSIEDVFVSIFAWGGQVRQIGRWGPYLQANVSSIKSTLSSIHSSGYSRRALINLLSISGMQISFASKFMFFYNNQNNTCILDNRVDAALSSITGFPTFINRSDKNKQCELYELYNCILSKITKKFKLKTMEMTEILLFNF